MLFRSAQLEVSLEGFISQFKELKSGVESSIKVLDGQIALKVSAGELCSEISATSEAIRFKTGKLEIETNNFTLKKDGTATFSGAITGGSININDRFVVSQNGTLTVQSTTFSKQITTKGLLYTNYMRIAGDADIEGYVNCGSMYVAKDVSCETLTQTSDCRLKCDIEDIADELSLQVVMGLKPKRFVYKASGVESMGFIAQEVDELQRENEIDLPLVDHTEEYLAIPYMNYVAVLVGAVQQNQKKIERIRRGWKSELL